MNENDFGSRGRSQRSRLHRNVDDKVQYLLRAEEQLLRSISGRAPLPEVLNGICSAIDRQIGNVVSVISVSEDDGGEVAAMAMNADVFGLSAYCSKRIVTEDGELLGSLEVYCCFPRHPSPAESQLIERGACLAAIAIENHRGTREESARHIAGSRPVRGHLLEWPLSMN
jgi:hypothetical protein